MSVHLGPLVAARGQVSDLIYVYALSESMVDAASLSLLWESCLRLLRGTVQNRMSSPDR